MLKKRLIGVITVRAGIAVQSFGYSRYLPLGRPEILAENLDRWGADEILVICIDRSNGNLGPDLNLLRQLSAIGLSTPLSYGGGVSTVEQGAAAIRSGAERICLDTVLHANPYAVQEMAHLLGSQALIAALPMVIEGGTLCCYDYHSKMKNVLSEELNQLLNQAVISEILLIDPIHDGGSASFDISLVEVFPNKTIPLIVFGGISHPTQIETLLSKRQIAAVAVGNSLNYMEHAIQSLKERMGLQTLRPANYISKISDEF
jgi:cyclase